MKSLRIACSITLILLLGGCFGGHPHPVSTYTPPPISQQPSDAPILHGDNLTVRVSGVNTEINEQVVVNEFGTITMPYIKEVKAEGLTPGVLAQNIEKAYLEGGYFTKLSVSIIPGQRDLYIRGEVRLPGRVPWSPGLTVVQAVSLAGGFTDYANRESVEVRRKEGVIVVNFKEAERDQSKDVAVLPRDDINVGRTLF